MSNENRSRVLTLLSIVAIAFAVFAPARADAQPKGTVYWCKDGTSVSYESSCKTHGGCCQTIAVHRPSKVTPDVPCIFDRWGTSVYRKDSPAVCALPAGKEPACVKGGGTLAKAGEVMYCKKALGAKSQG